VGLVGCRWRTAVSVASLSRTCFFFSSSPETIVRRFRRRSFPQPHRLPTRIRSVKATCCHFNQLLPLSSIVSFWSFLGGCEAILPGRSNPGNPGGLCLSNPSSPTAGRVSQKWASWRDQGPYGAKRRHLCARRMMRRLPRNKLKMLMLRKTCSVLSRALMVTKIQL